MTNSYMLLQKENLDKLFLPDLQDKFPQSGHFYG